MRWIAVLSIALVACAACHPQAPPRAGAAALRPFPVGYVSAVFTDDSRHRSLKTLLWYPATAGTPVPNVTYDHAFFGAAAKDAPYAPGPPRPLVLLSHGDKGSNLDQSWLAEILAANGYVVAAVTHWKNTWNDYEPAETVKVWHRPQDLSFLLDRLLTDPVWAARIDPGRIGAAGHSSGGYTVLALAGARYSPLDMGAYCQSPQRGRDCALAKGLPVQQIDFTPSRLSYRDARVRAVFAMAPALGPGLEADSLRAIAIPVEIAAATNDELLPFDLHAGRDAREIPGARLLRLPHGGHFVFMPECTWVTRAFTYFGPFDVCGRGTDGDRAALHEQVAAEARHFFADSLAAH